MGKGKIKGRSSITYTRKVNAVKKWYEARLKCRETWSDKKKAKLIELKPLEFYVDKIKQPNKGK